MRRPPLVRVVVPLLVALAAGVVNLSAFRRAGPNPFAPVWPNDSVTPTRGFLPPDPPEWLRRHDDSVIAARRGPFDLVFLGDSLTDGWADCPDEWRTLTAGRTAGRFGIPGDHTNQLLWRIDHGLLDGPSPKAVVVLIGTNNRRRTDDAADIAAGVIAVGERVRAKWPASRLLILGVPPEGRWPTNPGRALFAAVNAKVAVETKRIGAAFHDFGSVLLSSDGELSEAISPDGTHFSAEGYRRIAAAVGPAIRRLLAE